MSEQVIPDIQAIKDLRNIVINKVGVKSLAYPIKFADKSGAIATKGVFNIYVNLPGDQKGTHMSRFVEVVHDNTLILSVANLDKLLDKAIAKFGQDYHGFIELEFDYFRKKSAPISGVTSFLDYKVKLEYSKNPKLERLVSVEVPVTTLCPCSKEISQFGAHNQRSHITIKAKISDDIFIEDLINIAENQASCDLYGILKRPDEKYVTEKAYLNPKFVEDIVRDISIALEQKKGVAGYRIWAENFESIHNHSAFAEIYNM